MIEHIIRYVPQRIHKRLRRHSFTYLRRRAYADWLVSLNRANQPVIVYQMGKVGSSTVTKTLQSFDDEFTTFQVHVLTKYWIQQVESQYRRASKDHGKAKLDSHLLASIYLRNQMDKNPDKRWKVISLVRDPVARNVSAFFQAFPIYFSKQAASLGKKGIAGMQTTELQRLFLEEFSLERHNLPLEWFQLHLQPAFDFDIYEEPFDKCRGYKIYQTERCDLLLLRMEDLEETLRPALREFLEVDVEEVSQTNVASQKKYAKIYQEFNNQLSLPKQYLDSMYGSRYADHFYRKDQLQRFKQKWLQPGAIK